MAPINFIIDKNDFTENDGNDTGQQSHPDDVVSPELKLTIDSFILNRTPASTLLTIRHFWRTALTRSATFRINVRLWGLLLKLTVMAQGFLKWKVQGLVRALGLVTVYGLLAASGLHWASGFVRDAGGLGNSWSSGPTRQQRQRRPGGAVAAVLRFMVFRV